MYLDNKDDSKENKVEVNKRRLTHRSSNRHTACRLKVIQVVQDTVAIHLVLLVDLHEGMVGILVTADRCRDHQVGSLLCLLSNTSSSHSHRHHNLRAPHSSRSNDHKTLRLLVQLRHKLRSPYKRVRLLQQVLMASLNYQHRMGLRNLLRRHL
jgi:hypothetical protein